METEGLFAPETPSEARERYEAVGPAARVVVREATRAMEFDAAEYDARVTGSVIETARDALFASLLKIHVGTSDEFEEWCTDHPAYTVQRTGSDNVQHVVWHQAPVTETAVAATFQEERHAAIGTLRRQAWGTVYRELLEDDQ
jgi:hypothetical protein